MDSKLPVWLSTGELLEKYHNFCFQHHFTERFMVRLFDAQLVRGHNNRKSKNIEILESSFLELLQYVNCNLIRQLYPTGDETFPLPAYCTHISKKPEHYFENTWYSAAELLAEYPVLQYYGVFSRDFINDCVDRGLVLGRFDKGHKQVLLSKSSFQELMYYRNNQLEQIKCDITAFITLRSC